MDPNHPQYFTAPEGSPVVPTPEATNSNANVPPPALVLQPADASTEMDPTEEDNNAFLQSLADINGEPVFEPYEAQDMDCSDCTVLREVLHQCDSRQMYFRVHGGDAPGTFDHATFEIRHAGIAGLPPTVLFFYVALFQRTHEWVGQFIARIVDMMRGDATGQVYDSYSSFCSAVCSNIAPPPLNNDPFMAAMFGNLSSLSQIFASSTAHSTAAAVAVPPAAPPPPAGSNLSSAGNVAEPLLLQRQRRPMRQLTRKKQTEQRERMKKMSIKDVAPYLHMTKADAAIKLDMSSSSITRVCRLNKLARWPARRIEALNKKIHKLEEDAASGQGLLMIKEKIEKLQAERAKIYNQLEQIIDTATDEHPTGNNAEDPPSPGGGNAGALPVGLN